MRKIGLEKNVWIILLFSALSHLFLYLSIGIVSVLEAEKYIDQAGFLLNSSFPSAPKYWFYLPIILLIATAQKLSLGYGFVVIVQSLISTIATILFYKAVAQLTNRKTALLAAIGLCVFVPFFSWDLHLYSDSIFISLSMILFYGICRFEKQKPGWLAFIWLITLVMIFTRPFGSLFIPPLMIYFLSAQYISNKVKWAILVCSIVFVALMFISIQAVFKGGEDMDAMKPFVEEHIVCFVPNNSNGAALDLKYYDNGIRDIFYYIIHNPWHFTKLMAARLFSFFRFTRDWYSTSHNLALAVFIIPVYSFFFWGVKKLWTKRLNMLKYVLALVILYPLASTLQCDDWHSRFTMPILPPIFAVAAYGFTSTLDKRKTQPDNQPLIN